MFSVDSLKKGKDDFDIKAGVVPLENFKTVELISMYSGIISAEDLDILN